MRITILPEAQAEGIGAREWFLQYSESSEKAFTRALEQALALLAENPLAGAPLDDGFRRLLVRGFRYALIYDRIEANAVVITAIAHASRAPRYWEERR